GYPAVQAQAEQPLRDAAPVNATRWALFRRLRARPAAGDGHGAYKVEPHAAPAAQDPLAGCGLGGGGHTPPPAGGRVAPTVDHSHRAACTPAVPHGPLWLPTHRPQGHQQGGGLRTGALVRAVVPPPSSKAGTYVGRLAVRASGNGNSTTARHGVVQGILVR